MDSQLIMYNITITAITLKYYSLPLGKIKFSKHFKWYAQLYTELHCDCLDVIAVSLKGQSKVRFFYIYSPNDFMQTECYTKEWEISVSKYGKNNFSDRTGLLSISFMDLNQIEIFNLIRKQKIHTFVSQAISRVCFSHRK